MPPRGRPRSRRGARGGDRARRAAPRGRTGAAPRRSAVGWAREVTDELERDGDAALHVARAEAVNGAVADTSREVLLRRNGVVVAGEHDEGVAEPCVGDEEEDLVAGVHRVDVRRRDEREQMLADRVFVADSRKGCSRARACAPARRSASAVTARAYRGIIPPVTPRQPDPTPGAEPERGFVLGVFAKGVDGEPSSRSCGSSRARRGWTRSPRSCSTGTVPTRRRSSARASSPS